MKLLFYFLFFFSFFSGLMVIYVENPVHSLLFLILTFCNLSGLILSLEAEFLTLLFIIVYVGAVAILFLFAIMMLDLKVAKYNNSLLSSLGGLFITIFCLKFFLFMDKDLVILLENDFYLEFSFLNWFINVDPFTNIEVLSELLYTHYFIPFIMVGLGLLLGMIGSILLTMDLSYKVKRQQLFEQVNRTFNRAFFLTKINKN